MITTSSDIDYQRTAENLVGIECNGLSVFALHRLKKPI
ncbi:hypothetical protein TFLX_02670 [Thermoflexales bacterium]|nr:hypothetical protein TFLX_02670 [Thermoflexales bacterium]